MKYKFTVVSAAWCSNCGALKHSLTEANIIYDVVDADTDGGMKYCSENGISGLPATIITDTGGNVVRKVIGLQPISVFRGYINDLRYKCKDYRSQ